MLYNAVATSMDLTLKITSTFLHHSVSVFKSVLLVVDVDASGKVTSFVEMSGEALKFHKPGK